AAGHDPDRAALAAACRRAEAAGLGVPCGPMDQVASALGVEAGAILLDCRSLDTRTVTLPQGTALVVVDSGIRRTLAGSGYADRVRECADAAARLGAESLRDITPADLRAVHAGLPDLLARRVSHVVSENARVLEAVACCEGGGSVADLGAIVDASHESLSLDFEVSLPDIDELVRTCRAVPGVRGARIVGAGFGGSVLAVVDAGEVDPAATAAAIAAPALVVHPSMGAHVLVPRPP
ncbi:MAG: galactokinase, partial [Acidimicrobiia bacterium]|nr:galactokinase [Acidimicrobiia bacterium]